MRAGADRRELRSLANQIAHAQEGNPAIGILLFLGAVAGAIAAIGGAVALIVSLVSPIFGDGTGYSDDYSLLKELDLGIQTAFLKEKLGEPAVARILENSTHATSDTAELTFLAFRRRDHLVTAIVNRNGSVQGLGITACNETFRPRIQTRVSSITLNSTKMSAVAEPDTVDYSIGGSGGFSYYVLDTFNGDSNASGFQRLIWGRFYRCRPESSAHDIIYNQLNGGYSGAFRASLNQYRSTWITNTVMKMYTGIPSEAVGSFINNTETQALMAPPE